MSFQIQPTFRRVDKKFCFNLEASNNATPFTTVMRSIDCQPLSVSTSASLTDYSAIESDLAVGEDSAVPLSTPEEIVWEKVNIDCIGLEILKKLLERRQILWSGTMNEA